MHLYTPLHGDVSGDLVPILPHVVTELPVSANAYLSLTDLPLKGDGLASFTEKTKENHLVNGTHVHLPVFFLLDDFVILTPSSSSSSRAPAQRPTRPQCSGRSSRVDKAGSACQCFHLLFPFPFCTFLDPHVCGISWCEHPLEMWELQHLSHM